MSDIQPIEDNVVALPRRNADNPARAVTDFVKEHPVLTVAGGVAVGVLVSALLPKGAARRAAGRAVTLAELAGAATAAFGRDAWDKAEDVGGELRERTAALGSAAAERAGRVREAAADRIAPAGDAASELVHRIADAASDFAARVRRKR